MIRQELERIWVRGVLDLDEDAPRASGADSWCEALGAQGGPRFR